MSLARQILRGMRGLVHPGAKSREIGDEVREYFEDTVAAYRERGLAEAEAVRAAQREFGNLQAAQEQVRSYGWENAVRTLWSDLRFAVRQLKRNPGFTVVSALTLELGIGASTAIFSAINPVLFKPLPYPQPERILMLWNTWKGARSEVAYGTYVELAQRSRTLDLAIYEPWQPALAGDAEPERLEGQSVSAGFFRVLGVAPAMGRDFRGSDEGASAARVVIVSDRLWRERLQSDAAIVGKAIKLNGDRYTIVGVMPRGFVDVLSPAVELWTPDTYDGSRIAREFNVWEWGNHLRLVGRVRAGARRAQAVEEVEQIARSRWAQFPRPRWASLDRGLIVDALQDGLAHTVKPALVAVFGAVLVVLAIACVNVINLVLARSARRGGEFAVRGALGASKRRMVRQLVTESLLLSVVGGVLGMGAAAVGVRVIVALSPAELPRREAIGFDPAAFWFAFALIAVIGVAAGLVPALHVLRHELQAGLQAASRRIAGGHNGTRRVLVTAEIAMALVLLVSAGLLLRSMQRLLGVNPGFATSHLLTLQVVTWGHQFEDRAVSPGADVGEGGRARRRFFEQALEAVRRLPGVESAAFTSLLPLSDDPPVVGEYGAQFEDQDEQGRVNVFRYAVSPGYCQTMGIPLLRGRLLDERDREGAPQAALISASLARHHFGSRDPIGQRLRLGPPNRPWYTVVGLVGDVKQSSLALADTDAVYLSSEQTWFADDTLSFVVRGRGDGGESAPAVPSSAGLSGAIKEAIWSVDRNQPIVRVTTMDRLMAVSEAQRRFVLELFEAFGVVALALAAVGLYGVLAGSVAERIHEIGVRMALGAGRGDILAMVLRDGMRLTAAGVVMGAGGAWAASRGIASLLFETSSLDPVSWLGMIALLAVVAVAACWIPAWHGTRVDPSTTLRTE